MLVPGRAGAIHDVEQRLGEELCPGVRRMVWVCSRCHTTWDRQEAQRHAWKECYCNPADRKKKRVSGQTVLGV